MPWPYYTMPSIQISALKAYLAENGVTVKASHFHVEIANWLGYSNYNKIIEDFLEDGESVYSFLLFDQMKDKVLNSEDLKKKNIVINGTTKKLNFPSYDFFDYFDSFHDSLLDQFDWNETRLVGFSLNFGQTVPSLYLARKIKKKNPNVKIIFGGAEASGELGVSLLDSYDFIDFICNGEGEKPLLELAKNLDSSDNINGIISQGNRYKPLSNNQIKDLKDLPCPDFSDYFEVISKKLNGDFSICTTLPIESSRGCYFNCTFCALNLQWENFRVVQKDVVVSNIEKLIRQYKILDFFFVDNITPTKVTQLCDTIIEKGHEIRAFYETRANLPKQHFKKLKEAGVVKVQLGIESFSSSLLSRFNKKSMAIHNLQGLKNCYQFKIQVVGNIISDYPYTTESEIEDSIKFIKYAKAYPPSLSFSTFALEVGSPDYRNADLNGIIIEGNYSLYKRIYPDDILRRLNLPRKAFTLKDFKHVSWQKVQDALDDWDHCYHQMKMKYGYDIQPLTWRDGRDFMLIEDYRLGRKDLYKFDKKIERDVYEFADQVVSLQKLFENFKGIYSIRDMKEVIDMFHHFDLMVIEDSLVMALAIEADND